MLECGQFRNQVSIFVTKMNKGKTPLMSALVMFCEIDSIPLFLFENRPFSSCFFAPIFGSNLGHVREKRESNTSTKQYPGGGYSHMYAIWVCAAVKGMVFKQFSLG